MKTVCLFDIDGTLLSAGGAGQHAMEQALEEVFGVQGPYHDIPAAGRTDWAITRDLFAFHDLEVTDHQWQRFLEAYLRLLPISMTTKNGQVLPGVNELLNELSRRDDVALGLLTGNLEVGARLKLRHFDIDHHFHFGGYGDSHLDRDDVARLAHRAAGEHLTTEIHADRLWVIGDTPADVKCGRAIGAKVLAVATGIHSISELEPSRPDDLRESLADVDSVLRTLIG
ncbi:HAD family hydrolase [Planctomicrobium piriforme]|uniref:phosphoglycolate phosphatase n=1 Tax=Planctomicrobium piriforme TaxID=1576369 RepID=A0A1I3BHM2_9PLAN|nr:HAD hydrolase-like protein [Planctomicrobium piriforme]SFH61231.1 Phosphoglycolate phosphatase, HAD superfamily [Planctomicrobium piriforme]